MGESLHFGDNMPDFSDLALFACSDFGSDCREDLSVNK